MSSIVSSLVRLRSVPRLTSGTVSSVRAPPSQTICTSARRGSWLIVTITSLISVRSSSLRSRAVVVSAAQRCGRSRISRVSARRSASVSGSGRRVSSSASLRRSRSSSASAASSAGFERARDEPVLGLARVELALRAAGFELGALDREPLAGQAILVLALELADRLRTRARARPG